MSCLHIAADICGLVYISCAQASALTATKLTNSPTHDLESGKMGVMGEMGGGGDGGNGESSTDRDGKRRNNVQSRKMGGTWKENGRKMGRNTHFSQSHILHFPQVENLFHSSICRNQVSTLTGGKLGSFFILRRTLPQRLVQMVVYCTALHYQDVPQRRAGGGGDPTVRHEQSCGAPSGQRVRRLILHDWR